MKKWLFAILLGAILVLGACGGDDNSENGAANNDGNGTEENSNNNDATNNTDKNEDGGDSVDSAAAEKVYKKNCANCHGGDLTGAMGPDLTTIGNDYDADEIADIIKNGTDGGMPPGQATGADVDLLANWLSEMK